MQKPRVPDFLKRLFARISEDEVPDLAAGLAYRFLFAIFPFAIFLAALAGFVAPALGMGDPTNQILGGVSDNLPPDVAQQIRPQLEAVLGQSRPGLLSIGAIAALWAATGGVGALIKGMNKAYDIDETRGFIKRTAVALALTVVGTIGILVAFVTIVGGSVLTQQVVSSFGISDTAWSVVSILRFPVVLAMVAVAVAVLFKFGPNVRVSFRWALAGGAVFAVGWLLGTVVFALYVANFANYSNTYGALGGVVILMLWFYLTGLALLIAAEVASLLAKEHEPERIEARKQELKASTPRRAGEVAGVAAGVAKAATGRADHDDDDAAHERRDPDRRAGRDHGDVAGDDRAPDPPARHRAGRAPEGLRQPRVPRPVTSQAHPADGGSRGMVAAAIVGAGALLGALLGRIAGDDDRGGAASH